MIDNYCTGSNGFLGKHLIERLEGKTISIPHRQILHFKIEPFRRFFFLSTYGNMAGQESIARILRGNVIDCGMVIEDVIHSGFSPESFIFVSSSSVGLSVQTAYSRAKRSTEEMLQGTSLPFCIVRPYSVTGLHEQKQHLIPTLIRSCMEGEEMELVPDATHDFIDVHDVVNGLVMLADQKAVGIFELGSGLAWTNLEVCEIVEEICGCKANIKLVKSMRSYDNSKWYCRNFEAGKYGWAPTKTLAHSIQEMVVQYKA